MYIEWTLSRRVFKGGPRAMNPLSRVRFSVIAFCVLSLVGGCSNTGPEDLLNQARAALERQDVNAAAIQLKALLQDYPETIEARFLLGRLSASVGDFGTAERELRRASEARYRLNEVLPLYALSLLELGQAEKVIKELDPELLTNGEARATLLAYRARALLRTNKATEASQLVDEILRAQPNSAHALVTRAQILARGNEPTAARDVLDLVLRRNERDVDALVLKATVDRVEGRIVDADASLQRVIAVAPTFTAPRAALALSLIEQGKLAEARPHVEELRKLPGGEFEAIVLDSQIAFGEKRFEAARNAAVQALKADPDYLPALAVAAASEYALGNLGPAEAALQKIVRQAPIHAPSRKFLAEVLIRQRNFEAVQQILQPLLSAAAADPQALKLLGEAALQSGEFDAARAAFQRLEQSNPTDTHARISAAAARILAGDSARGIAELERIGVQEPTQFVSDLVLAMIHIRARDLHKAEASVAALKRKQPDHPHTYTLLGTVLAAKGDVQAARTAFERALAIKSNYGIAAINLAKLDGRQGNPEEARRRLEEFLSRHPSNARVLVALAEMKAASGAARDEVGSLLKKAHSENPRLLAPHLALVQWYIEGDEHRKAVDHAQQAVWAHSNVPDALLALGRAQLAAGDASQSVATYRQLVQGSERRAESHVALAHALVAANDLDGARRSLQRVLQIDKTHKGAQLALIELEARAGEDSKALELAAAFHRAQPNSLEAYAVEGDLHVRGRRFPAAADAYAKALALGATTPIAIKYHDTLLAAGRLEDAKKHGTSWLSSRPKDSSFKLYLAQLALASRDYEGAKRGFLEVLELQPATSGVLNNLAWACFRTKDDCALGYAERAYKLAPNDANVLDTLGVIRLQRGETQEAVDLHSRAATLAPKSPTIGFNYANALARVGRKEQARQVLEAVMELKVPFGEMAEARRLLGSL